jgi:hypothetical protein
MHLLSDFLLLDVFSGLLAVASWKLLKKQRRIAERKI